MTPVKICHLIKISTANPLLFSSIKFSDRNKFSYSVASLDSRGALHDQMMEIGVPAISLDKQWRKQFPQTVASLVRYFRRERFDIVQVHGFEASVVGLPAARLAGVKRRIFSGHHSHEVPLHNNRKLTMVDSFLAGRLATHVIAPSLNMRDIFIQAEHVPPERIHVIPHGIDIDYWSAEKHGNTSLRGAVGSGDAIVFGAVGRLYWIKAFDHLLKAFAPIAKQHPEAVLWIVGEGADKAELQLRARDLGISERVFFLGAREDIADVVSTFDIFIHTSLAESFGLVYVEAMALKKPVIGTAVGIAPELIEDGINGYVVPPGDVDEISRAMEKILEHRSDWKTMGENARRSSERYSVARTQAECDDFYSSLF